MARRKEKSPKSEEPLDLIFIFKNLKCEISPDENLYSKDEIDDIKMIVNTLAKEIVIDRSYVQYDGNQHSDIFMLEYGWNKICKLVVDTKLGAKASSDEYLSM